MKEATKARLEFAHRDLEAAEALIDNEYLANVVIFHAQQCHPVGLFYFFRVQHRLEELLGVPKIDSPKFLL